MIIYNNQCLNAVAINNCTQRASLSFQFGETLRSKPLLVSYIDPESFCSLMSNAKATFASINLLVKHDKNMREAERQTEAEAEGTPVCGCWDFSYSSIFRLRLQHRLRHRPRPECRPRYSSIYRFRSRSRFLSPSPNFSRGSMSLLPNSHVTFAGFSCCCGFWLRLRLR